MLGQVVNAAAITFGVEVIAGSSGQFIGNGMAFPSFEDADRYGSALMGRWTLVEAYRVVARVESTEETHGALSGQIATPFMLALGLLGGAFTLSGHTGALLAGIAALVSWLASLAQHSGSVGSVASLGMLFPFALPIGAIPVNTRGEALCDDATFSAMVARVLDLVQSATPEETTAGSLWYRVYGAMIVAQGARYGLTAAQSVGLFAVLSPRRNPQANYSMFVGYLASRDTKRMLARQIRQCAEIVASVGTVEAVSLSVTGLKVSTFFRNLLGDSSEATIDRHAYAACVGYADDDNKGVTPKQSALGQAVYRVAASLLDSSVSTVQAIAWIVWRNRKGIVDRDLSSLLTVRESGPAYAVPTTDLDEVYSTRKAAMNSVVCHGLGYGHSMYGWSHDREAGYSATGCMVCGITGYVQESLSNHGHTYAASLPTVQCVGPAIDLPDPRVDADADAEPYEPCQCDDCTRRYALPCYDSLVPEDADADADADADSGASCVRCGASMNPAEVMLGSVCGQCVRRNHRAVTGA